MQETIQPGLDQRPRHFKNAFISHYTTGVPGNRPITKGQGYSTIAWIPEASGSWALPLRHERITSWETPIDKAVWQLKQVCRHLPQRPISHRDSEYGCAPFVLKTASIATDKLMRLRSNLCLWGAPPSYSGRGRLGRYGDKFKLNDTSSWIQPALSEEVNDPKLGRLKISVLQNLHFRAAAKHPLSLLLVERLNHNNSERERKTFVVGLGGGTNATII